MYKQYDKFFSHRILLDTIFSCNYVYVPDNDCNRIQLMINKLLLAFDTMQFF